MIHFILSCATDLILNCSQRSTSRYLTYAICIIIYRWCAFDMKKLFWFRTAYDVSLYDDNWSEDVFVIVAGNTSMSWERLDAWVLILLVTSNNLISISYLFLIKVYLFDVSGAALSHSFELEATKKTVFYGAPAVITFRIPTKAALQVSHSCLYGSTLYAWYGRHWSIMFSF